LYRPLSTWSRTNVSKWGLSATLVAMILFTNSY